MLTDKQSSIIAVISAKTTLKCFCGITETFCNPFELLIGKLREGILKWKQHTKATAKFQKSCSQ